MMRYQNFSREELVALATANAPNPPEQHIETQHRMDQFANPHNDPPPKKPRRSREEIVAQYKLEHGLQIIKTVEKHFNGY